MAEDNAITHFVAVDDDRMILDAITSILEAAGHRVTAFTDSREAMDKLPELQPDCIISDLMMPDVDGFQLCKFARGGGGGATATGRPGGGRGIGRGGGGGRPAAGRGGGGGTTLGLGGIGSRGGGGRAVIGRAS